jgi:hypothetical protein
LQVNGPLRTRSLPPVRLHPPCAARPVALFSTSLDGSEVAQWMTELDGFDIPDLTPTNDGTCAGDPTAAADAASRGWWTCGGYTRPTDITSCPSKMTWGVSFDDGPAFYSQYSPTELTMY